jgi:hypothetical protein
MAGLDPAIQRRPMRFNKVLDGRVKPGHDKGGSSPHFDSFTRTFAGMTPHGLFLMTAGINEACGNGDICH